MAVEAPLRFVRVATSSQISTTPGFQGPSFLRRIGCSIEEPRRPRSTFSIRTLAKTMTMRRLKMKRRSITRSLREKLTPVSGRRRLRESTGSSITLKKT
jgi:hypothetical protein